MMVMEAKVTRIKITGRRKEKLGLEKGKKEEEEMRLGKKSGTFLLYTLKGNNNYEILIIPLRKKIQDITFFPPYKTLSSNFTNKRKREI